MAVGYSRTATVQVLLDFGADPEVGDKDGKNVMDLVEKLRGAMPLSPELLGRRTMLEDVAGVLMGAQHVHEHCDFTVTCFDTHSGCGIMHGPSCYMMTSAFLQTQHMAIYTSSMTAMAHCSA